MHKSDTTVDKNPANRDPITGAPGSHPVGTGLGAAAGGAATGAAVGSVVGPIGTAAGIVVGAVVGGWAGKGVAEKIDPTVEDAYWKENYRNRHYVDKNASYDTYRPAYRTGYQAYSKYPGKSYDEVESELQRDYERSSDAATLKWENARHASRDAWNRVDQNRRSGSKKA